MEWRPTAASARVQALRRRRIWRRVRRHRRACSDFAAALLHPRHRRQAYCMLVMYDPSFAMKRPRGRAAPDAARAGSSHSWSVIEPQSRIRLPRPKTREARSQVETDRIGAVSDACAGFEGAQGSVAPRCRSGPSASRAVPPEYTALCLSGEGCHQICGAPEAD